MHIERRAREGAPLALVDADVARLGNAVDELRPLRRQAARRDRRRLVDVARGPVGAVSRPADMDEKHWRPGFAEARGEVLGSLYHLFAGARRERHRDDTLLEIDEDQGGALRIEPDRIGHQSSAALGPPAGASPTPITVFRFMNSCSP